MRIRGRLQFINERPHVVGTPDEWRGEGFDDWEIALDGSDRVTVTGRSIHLGQAGTRMAGRIMVSISEGEEIIVERDA